MSQDPNFPELYGLIWITGLPEAGKTTIAKHLNMRLRENGINPVWLDGNILRKDLLIDGNFKRLDRLKIAQQYCNLAKTFVDQKHLVVCSTISMFHEIYEWNQMHISPYLEVFLDVPEKIRAERDEKGHFKDIEAKNTADFAGFHFPVDQPKSPHLHIKNFGQNSVEDSVSMIWQKLFVTCASLNNRNQD